MSNDNSNYSESLTKWIFSGMRRDEDMEIYYNKETNDVQQLVEGYLSSNMADDQGVENRKLLHKIQSSANHDEITDGIHYLLPRLKVSAYLQVFRKFAASKATFIESADNFESEVKGRLSMDSRQIYLSDYFLKEFLIKVENSCNGDRVALTEFGAIYKMTQRYFGLTFLKSIS